MWRIEETLKASSLLGQSIYFLNLSASSGLLNKWYFGGIQLIVIQTFPFPKLVDVERIINPVCPTIYP